MEHISKVIKNPLEHRSQDIPDPKSYKDPEEKTPEQKRAEYLLNYGGVTDLAHTFENMRQPQGYANVYYAFKAMAEGTATWHMFLVYGGSGNGKTLGCEATVITLYDRNIRAQRERWADIVRFTLKASFNSRYPVSPEHLPYEEVFKKLRTKKYLIIDDVGMGSTGGNWEWGELEDIIDYRLENKLFTIITTNLDLKELPPRIVSRLKDSNKCRLVFNEAKDQRGIK